MKKIYSIENLCCANCASKMENSIQKIDGVEECRVNFLTQKFTLSANDEIFDDVLEKAKKIIKKIEPDCEIK